MPEDWVDDDLIMVAVPRPHLGAVYELLARRMTGDSPVVKLSVVGGAQSEEGRGEADEMPCRRCDGTADRGVDESYKCRRCGYFFYSPWVGVRVDSENGVWTRSMIHELKQELDSQVALTALDQIARSAPRIVSYGELLTATGVERNRLRAELGALSKVARRLFGKKTWPMTARQGWGGGDRMGYRMPPEVAEWWLEDSLDTAKSKNGGL